MDYLKTTKFSKTKKTSISRWTPEINDSENTANKREYPDYFDLKIKRTASERLKIAKPRIVSCNKQCNPIWSNEKINKLSLLRLGGATIVLPTIHISETVRVLKAAPRRINKKADIHYANCEPFIKDNHTLTLSDLSPRISNCLLIKSYEKK